MSAVKAEPALKDRPGRTRIGHLAWRSPLLKRLFVGSPLATAQAKHERLGKIAALAIFCSDAAVVGSLRPRRDPDLPGAGRDRRAGHDGPDRAGNHHAHRRRLHLILADDPRVPRRGRRLHRGQGKPGHAPGAGRRRIALLVGYVLTVAVSVAAGVAAITSAFPRPVSDPRGARAFFA
ncbi:MAG: hypothetical protein MZV64_70535 [Ignavibacteriales bacterium]|nr:hypothetical protein [Ignavibacteriales bacterium]